jgi:hypothetical protein
MAHERADVIDPVSFNELSSMPVFSFPKTCRSDAPDHRWAFEADAPSVHMHVLRETHGLEHLGAEHTAVAHLDPLL